MTKKYMEFDSIVFHFKDGRTKTLRKTNLQRWNTKRDIIIFKREGRKIAINLKNVLFWKETKKIKIKSKNQK
ncbi:MAG: hypothetical protein BTN85_2112 [Candidatus Methanohalarchaeum thermophilum]|uniref:Uncharacterized protein n=1 Tax=Methanohalarchaeum thermophilum TaxID=1903181 RepID=A0A1Q6DSZ8_METT1|nr:MAG: hypothetical protein BTN85_2112 [Candidatus Methanohalarchaeum thermophilum]